MTHASWNNERGRPSGPGHDNERLEYLGDAVLELVVGEYLFRRFPGYDEGQLTQLRAALVNTLSLARLAERLQLGDALLLGRGAAKTGANQLPRLLANCFEALIGAIFLDHGYRVATRVFIQNIGDLQEWTDQNFKGRLQEAAQERTGQAPQYRVSAIGGPGHRRLYSADAVVGGEVMGTGTGATKQAAEQVAARAALEAMQAQKGRRRAPADPASTRAAAAAQKAAAGAASEPVRIRRRIAEAAAEQAVPGRAPQRSSAKPAEAVPPPVSGQAKRSRGFLSALRSAAEALVGRSADDTAPAAAPAPPPPVPIAAPRSAPPAATPAAPRTPAAAATGEAAPEGGPSRTRRGRRGGRGRRRPAGDASAPTPGATGGAVTPAAPTAPGGGAPPPRPRSRRSGPRKPSGGDQVPR
jgi:ribonuclease-3